MEEGNPLQIDKSTLYHIHNLDVKFGDCIVGEKRVYILIKTVIRKTTGHMTSYYDVLDFFSNIKTYVFIRNVSFKSEEIYKENENPRVNLTKIQRCDYALMSVDEDNKLCLMDLNSCELKENVEVNLESEESKSNLGLAKRFLEECKEVTVTLTSAAGISKITRVTCA